MRRLLVALALVAGIAPALGRERWSEHEAQVWYARQPWLVGANFLPSTAINQLEMWQAATFDPATIERELGWAEAIGMNTMRVFLHDLLWQQDADGFAARIDAFLAIAARHHIRLLLVLFDSCWDPEPKLGPQHAPVPGVHNSGWVQSPSAAALMDPGEYPRLRAYVAGVVGRFANDPRILGWDLWNEPDNEPSTAYPKTDAKDKNRLVAALLPQVFAWARSANPTQPLTTPLWKDRDDWSSRASMTPFERMQVDESDVISFHNYQWPEQFERRVRWLQALHRPLICSEYMARPFGSTIDAILPIAKRQHVAAINWGLVDGKEQTRYPWDSWDRAYTANEPPVWLHDLFRADGTPYRQREIDIIRTLTARGSGH